MEQDHNDQTKDDNQATIDESNQHIDQDHDSGQDNGQNDDDCVTTGLDDTSPCPQQPEIENKLDQQSSTPIDLSQEASQMIQNDDDSQQLTLTTSYIDQAFTLDDDRQDDDDDRQANPDNRQADQDDQHHSTNDAIQDKTNVQEDDGNTIVDNDQVTTQTQQMPHPLDPTTPQMDATTDQGDHESESNAAASTNVYQIKWIQWKGLSTPIITQNRNGPCPLIAIVNILLLTRKITLSMGREYMTSEELMEYLVNTLLTLRPKVSTHHITCTYMYNHIVHLVFHHLSHSSTRFYVTIIRIHLCIS